MSRIANTFEELRRRGQRALVPFITAGDPRPALTVPMLHALVAAGADILELGVPFSDPMADGPVIQRAHERALAHGVSLEDVLAMVAEFRREDARTPVVLMGYANPVEALGQAAFARAARLAGVDGVITVDYPPEESAEFAAALTAQDIDPIYLVAPTTRPERLKTVARLARGFVYYVSLKGVTGASHFDLDDVARRVEALKRVIALPIGVGFGIRDAASGAAVARFADAVVMGSRLVQLVESTPEAELCDALGRLVRDVRRAMDAATRAAA